MGIWLGAGLGDLVVTFGYHMVQLWVGVFV